MREASETLQGVEIHLDLEGCAGFVRVRDTEPRASLHSILVMLMAHGWKVIEDDETIEPYVFPDGAVGVTIWLYRPELVTVTSAVNLKAKAA